jgi:hypothetical protein
MDSSSVAIIVAVISLLASVTGNILQYLNDKKKTNTDAMALLITKALEMNKQELEVVRLISDDLRTQLNLEKEHGKVLENKIEVLEVEKENLKKENESLKRRLSIIEDRESK